MLLRSSLLIGLSFGLTAAIGCGGSDLPADAETAPPASTVTLANAVCPIMGGAAKDDITVEWNGKTIGFCCAECIPEWNALTDEEKSAKLVLAAKTEDDVQHDDAKHNHGDHEQTL